MFLRMHNLPYQAHEEAIREFFFGFSIPMNCVKLYYRGHNKEASVWFNTEEDLLSAFMLDGKSMFDQRMKLLLSTEDPSDPTSKKPTPPLLDRSKEWDRSSSGSEHSYIFDGKSLGKRKYATRGRSNSRERDDYDAGLKRLRAQGQFDQSRESEMHEHSRSNDRYGGNEGRRAYEPSREPVPVHYVVKDSYDTGRDRGRFGLDRYGEQQTRSPIREGQQYKTRSPSRERQPYKESLNRLSVKSMPYNYSDELVDHQLYGLPKTRRTEAILERAEYTQDPKAYMTLINSFGFKDGEPSNASRDRSPDPMHKPRSLSPVRSEYVNIPQAFMPRVRAQEPQKVSSLLDISVKPVPLKQQPFMSLFPNFLNGKRFYLAVSGMPPEETASDVWAWVDGTRGQSEGVIFGFVPRNHSLGMPSRAFIVCENLQELRRMQQTLPVPLEQTTLCTPEEVNSFLQQLDSKCQIWVTNPATGKDTMLTLEERVKIYFKQNTHLPTAIPTALKLGELGLRGKSADVLKPMPYQDPLASRGRSTVSESFPLSSGEVSMQPVNPAALPKKAARPTRYSDESFMSLFPSFLNERRFYLEVTELPPRTTAAAVWSWVGGVKGKSDGVIFVNVPPNQSLFTSSRAFIVFENKQDLLEMQRVIPMPPEQISPCFPDDVNLCLQQLDDKCQVWVTNMKEGKDSRLTTRERAEILVKAEPGLLGDAPGQLEELPNMAAPWLVTHQKRSTGMRPQPQGFSAPQMQPKKVTSLLDMNVEPVPMKMPPFMSLFPAFLNGRRFYMEVSELPPDITASEVWAWVMGTRGNSEGVILGWVPQKHPLGQSRAFIVYESMHSLIKAAPMVPTRTTQCSPIEVNKFLKALDLRCEIYVTNPSLGKDTQLSLHERADIYMTGE